MTMIVVVAALGRTPWLQPFSRGHLIFGCTFAVIPGAGRKSFAGPTFRKGLWRFVRTLEIANPQTLGHRLLEREMTRCVDPTQAMQATFSSESVGSCHSSRPEKVNNKYILEPVRLHGAC